MAIIGVCWGSLSCVRDRFLSESEKALIAGGETAHGVLFVRQLLHYFAYDSMKLSMIGPAQGLRALG